MVGEAEQRERIQDGRHRPCSVRGKQRPGPDQEPWPGRKRAASYRPAGREHQRDRPEIGGTKAEGEHARHQEGEEMVGRLVPVSAHRAAVPHGVPLDDHLHVSPRRHRSTKTGQRRAGEQEAQSSRCSLQELAGRCRGGRAQHVIDPRHTDRVHAGLGMTSEHGQRPEQGPRRAAPAGRR